MRRAMADGRARAAGRPVVAVMRLLVCGSLGWTEIETPYREIDLLRPTVLIHGATGCATEPRSSDMLFGWLARQWATHGVRRALEVLQFPADWQRDGRAAGPIRNARMLRDGMPDRGLAFGALWRPASAPRRGHGGVIRDEQTGWKHTGTGDMVAKMLRAGLPVRWVPEPGASAIDLVEMPEPPEVLR